MARTNTHSKNGKQNKTQPQPGKQQDVKKEQPNKDSGSKRVNYDNTRESKFRKDVQEERHSRKGYDKPMQGGADNKQSGRSNDVAWYAHNEELLRAAAQIPFTDSVGDKLNPEALYAFPGVMAVQWVPNIDGDAVNQSANSHYSFTVHANSRNYRYDAPDQMMLILAGAQLFTAIAMGIRAYGVMRRFDQLDRYTPAALVTAMGFDYQDLKKNLSRMWFDINEMVARSSQIWIPKDMPVIERWFWMSSHIYRDATSVKAQYYLYVPKQLLSLSEVGSVTGTSLKPNNWNPNQPNTWDQYVEIVNGMFDALLQSQDRGIILGDILAAYGAERIFALAGIDSSYMVEPVYDAEVLTQFENAVAVPALLNGVVQSDTGVISSEYALYSLADAQLIKALYSALLNFHQNTQPTPAQIMVATRMMALGMQVTTASTGGEAPQVGFKPITCGTEYPFSFTIYTNQYDKSSSIPTLGKYVLGQFIDNDPSYDTVLAQQLWDAFDWCPARYRIKLGNQPVYKVDWTQVGSKRASYADNEVQEIDMYTHVDIPTLDKMHRTAIYSEFGVPTIL